MKRLEEKYGPDVFADFICDFIEKNSQEGSGAKYRDSLLLTYRIC